jgi:hypothetical protein
MHESHDIANNAETTDSTLKFLNGTSPNIKKAYHHLPYYRREPETKDNQAHPGEGELVRLLADLSNRPNINEAEGSSCPASQRNTKRSKDAQVKRARTDKKWSENARVTQAAKMRQRSRQILTICGGRPPDRTV